jgi:hypothetical protein
MSLARIQAGTLSILNEMFRGFAKFLQANAKIELRLENDRFCPYPLQSAIDAASIHLPLYSPDQSRYWERCQ